jgi:murein DD-endopeptidase MepM/ murein hydrolase activator NlpD
MNLKLTNFSTIIIVNKNQEQTQAIRVKTKHLKRVKHYIASIVCVIAALVGTVIYLHSKNADHELERKVLLTQIEQLKGRSPVIAVTPDGTSAGIAPGPVNVSAPAVGSASNYIQSIQAKLQKINDYLRKRGLKGFSIKSVGGDGNAEESKLTDNEKYSMYDEYLSRLLNSVAFTPMGYPRISSITSAFGYRSDPFDSEDAEYHPGIDFRGHKGDAVKTTANGKVIFTGWKGGYGNCIIVKHANDFETLYGHLSRIGVKEGQEVSTGDVIGKIGSTGHSTGAHLHYEVRKNGKPVNPAKFLTLNN